MIVNNEEIDLTFAGGYVLSRRIYRELLGLDSGNLCFKVPNFDPYTKCLASIFLRESLMFGYPVGITEKRLLKIMKPDEIEYLKDVGLIQAVDENLGITVVYFSTRGLVDRNSLCSGLE